MTESKESSDLTESQKESPFDWDSEFVNDSTTHYSDYWDDDLSYFDNVMDLHNRIVWLGDTHTQNAVSHVVTTYALAHSLALEFCPILFYCGKSGSAKSESGKFIAAIREADKSVIGAQCTFASVRNIINENRWYNWSDYLSDTSRNNERPMILVWADIKESDLAENRQLYSLLRNGCDRKEDRLLIAGEDGKNKEFYVFCPKVISSIEPFYSYPKWSELRRRILLVKTRVLDKSIEAQSFRENQIFLDHTSFKGANRHFIGFWNRENLTKLAYRRKHGKIKALMLKSGFTEHEIKASQDLALQHSILNDCTVSESIDIFGQYWQLARQWIELQGFSLETILQGLLSEYSQTKVDGIPLCIEHAKCVSALKDASFTAKSSDIGAFMISKGFKPVKKSSKQFWVEEIS